MKKGRNLGMKFLPWDHISCIDRVQDLKLEREEKFGLKFSQLF